MTKSLVFLMALVMSTTALGATRVYNCKGVGDAKGVYVRGTGEGNEGSGDLTEGLVHLSKDGGEFDNSSSDIESPFASATLKQKGAAQGVREVGCVDENGEKIFGYSPVKYGVVYNAEIAIVLKNGQSIKGDFACRQIDHGYCPSAD